MNFGEYGQVFIHMQELTDLLSGKLEETSSLVIQIGMKAAQEIRDTAMSGDLGKANAQLLQALKLTEDQIKANTQATGTMGGTVAESFKQAVGATEVGKELGGFWHELLVAVNDDLRKGGIIWVTIQSTLAVVSVSLLAIESVLKLINVAVTGIVLPVRYIWTWLTRKNKALEEQHTWWTKIGNHWVFQKIAQWFKDRIKDTEDGIKIMQDYIDKVEEVEEKVDNEAQARLKAKLTLERLTIQAKEYEKTSKAQLDTDKRSLELKKAQAQFGAEGVARARAELAFSQQRALKETAVARENIRIANETLTKADLALDTKRREELNTVIQVNEEKIQQIAHEMEITKIAQREVMLRDRLKQIDADISNTQMMRRAQSELQMTRMIAQQTSLSAQIKAENESQRENMLDELEGLQKKMAELDKEFGHEKAILNIEYQTLQARRAVLETMIQQNQEAEAHKLRQIDITKEIDKQKSLLAIEDIKSGGRQASAQIKFESDQVKLNQQLLTQNEESYQRQKLQLDLRKLTVVEDNKSLANAREKAFIDYESATINETNNDLKEKALRTLNEELAKYHEQLRVNMESLDVLEEQYGYLENMKDLELTKELASGLNGAVRGFIDGLVDGEVQVQDFLKGMSKSFLQKAMGETIEKMINNLVTKLQDGITSVAESLANAFGGSGGFWGAFLNGMMAVGLAAISSLFNQQKAEVESLADEAKGTIESVERTRGLIAGETAIRIAEISDNLSKALRPTNSILERIERAILNQSMSGSQNYGSKSQPAAYPGYSITTEILSSSRV